MAYAIRFKNSVHNDIDKINKADIGKIFQKIFKILSTNPEHCKPLTGKFKGLRRLRVGEYRVIFVIIADEVLILQIGHRKDVYN